MWLINNKVKIIDSGIMEGFHDCHCHLLPGVDDGVKEMRESLRILKLWEQAGMTEVWLTPHIMEDIPNKPKKLKEEFEQVKEAYKGNIVLKLAAENMMDNLFLERLQKGDLLPIGKNREYLLVETSYYNPPIDMDGIIEQVKERAFIPILAHPERYQYMDIGDYKKWKQRGVRLQLNVPSLVGAYGPEVQKKSEMLLQKGMYDYCGTDTHNYRFADFFLQGKLSKKFAKEVKRIAEEMDL